MPSPTTSMKKPGDDEPRASKRRLRGGVRVLITLVASFGVFTVGMIVATELFTSHDHGTLDIVVGGTTIDLDQPAFHDRDPVFHIHEGSGNYWHQHPAGLRILSFEPVTLGRGLETLGFEVAPGRFTADATSTAADVLVTANGVVVDPATYVLGDGDALRIEVRARP